MIISSCGGKTDSSVKAYDNLLTFYGDSITFGTNSSGAAATYPALVAAGLGKSYLNNGVSGQCITINAPTFLNTATLPYRTIYDRFSFAAHVINDCWQTHDGGMPNTVANFQTSITNYYNVQVIRGLRPCQMKWITGFYCADPVVVNPGTGQPYFTVAQYQTYVAGAVVTCVSLGIQCINLTGTTYALNADNVHPAGDASYVTIANAILAQLT